MILFPASEPRGRIAREIVDVSLRDAAFRYLFHLKQLYSSHWRESGELYPREIRWSRDIYPSIFSPITNLTASKITWYPNWLEIVIIQTKDLSVHPSSFDEKGRRFVRLDAVASPIHPACFRVKLPQSRFKNPTDIEKPRTKRFSDYEKMKKSFFTFINHGNKDLSRQLFTYTPSFSLIVPMHMFTFRSWNDSIITDKISEWHNILHPLTNIPSPMSNPIHYCFLRRCFWNGLPIFLIVPLNLLLCHVREGFFLARSLHVTKENKMISPVQRVLGILNG